MANSKSQGDVWTQQNDRHWLSFEWFLVKIGWPVAKWEGFRFREWTLRHPVRRYNLSVWQQAWADSSSSTKSLTPHLVPAPERHYFSMASTCPTRPHGEQHTDACSFGHFETRAIHVGQEPTQWAHMQVVPPITLSTTAMQNEPRAPQVSTLCVDNVKYAWVTNHCWKGCKVFKHLTPQCFPS